MTARPSMRILTMKVFLFITNIPEDLDAIDEGYLEKEINELNQKAFVIVIFVHPMADDELRTIPYRWSPNYTLHEPIPFW